MPDHPEYNIMDPAAVYDGGADPDTLLERLYDELLEEENAEEE